MPERSDLRSKANQTCCVYQERTLTPVRTATRSGKLVRASGRIAPQGGYFDDCFPLMRSFCGYIVFHSADKLFWDSQMSSFTFAEFVSAISAGKLKLFFQKFNQGIVSAIIHNFSFTVTGVRMRSVVSTLILNQWSNCQHWKHVSFVNIILIKLSTFCEIWQNQPLKSLSLHS